ncbi:MAG TPA: chemotaxis protein CheW [Anaeromyxobacter sp.]|nr:chemotaxis protein CheW [Anaeromyxobacter sp.]
MSEAVAEIVLFQVGVHVFAAPVRDVLRIGAVRDSAPEELVLETALGRPFTRERGMVVASAESERTLVVDQVIGFRTVPEEDVRPLPAFARACIPTGVLAGMLLLDDLPTPVIDLQRLVRERGEGPSPAP